jgi:hypothetical protein
MDVRESETMYLLLLDNNWTCSLLRSCTRHLSVYDGLFQKRFPGPKRCYDLAQPCQTWLVGWSNLLTAQMFPIFSYLLCIASFYFGSRPLFLYLNSILLNQWYALLCVFEKKNLRRVGLSPDCVTVRPVIQLARWFGPSRASGQRKVIPLS